MKEEWRDVVGFEGLYEVSNTGKIRSLDQYVRVNLRGIETVRFQRGREISPLLGKNGYYSIVLCKNGIHTRTTFHRVVATAFLPNPENKRTVNHKNGIKTDNNVDNLEWATDAENICHAYGSRLNRHKKPLLQIKNGSVVNEFESAVEAEKALNQEYQERGLPIPRGVKSNLGVAAKKGKYAYGYQWKFKGEGRE